MSVNSVARRTWRRAVVVATCLVLIALADLPGMTSSATAAAAPASQPKSTIVLVHGAWAEGPRWSGVIPLLQQQGYTVDVAPNPPTIVARTGVQHR